MELKSALETLKAAQGPFGLSLEKGLSVSRLAVFLGQLTADSKLAWAGGPRSLPGLTALPLSCYVTLQLLGGTCEGRKGPTVSWLSMSPVNFGQ